MPDGIPLPNYDAMLIVQSLHQLAADIDRMRFNGAPTAEDLQNAPTLEQWTFGVLPTPCLVGSVIGHPILGHRSSMHTSELFVVDPALRWARTLSRFYRLGTPFDETVGGHA